MGSEEELAVMLSKKPGYLEAGVIKHRERSTLQVFLYLSIAAV